jgi:hypothetical protein
MGTAGLQFRFLRRTEDESGLAYLVLTSPNVISLSALSLSRARKKPTEGALIIPRV